MWWIAGLVALVGFVLLWRKYGRSSSVGADHASAVQAEQSLKRGPRQGGGPM